VYVSEENINQLQLESSIKMDKYYEYVNNYVSSIIGLGSQPELPKSIFWDSSALSDLTYLQNKKETNDKYYIIYKGKIKLIQESQQNLVKSCEEITNTITPNISRDGFVLQCNKLIESKPIGIPEYNFKNNYWISKTVKNYNIQITEELTYNLNRVAMDAWKENMIDEVKPDDYLSWVAMSNGADNDLDSLYFCVADALNAQMDIDENETTNPYAMLVNGKRIFTVNTLKRMVNDNKGAEDVSKWENVYKIIQLQLRIRIIIFELTKRTSVNINVGDIVDYQGYEFRVVGYNSTTDVYDIYNGYYKLEGVEASDIKETNNNILSDFRVVCSDFDSNEEFDDFMFVSLSENKRQNGSSFLKFDLIQRKTIIMSFGDIPMSIKYFIYNSCGGQLSSTNALKYGLGAMATDITEFVRIINKNFSLNDVVDKINEIKIEVEEKETRYAELESKMVSDGLSVDEQSEKMILSDEIESLQAKLDELETIVDQVTRIQSQMQSGGEVNMQVQPSQSQYPPGYYMYVPGQPLVTSAQQKPNAKDTKSKLAFYISIELELFPGKSVSLANKSAVKCQGVFERIREAWADIFGYQYRPSPLYMPSQKADASNPTSDASNPTSDASNPTSDASKVGGRKTIKKKTQKNGTMKRHK
jgi:hypothetical protein